MPGTGGPATRRWRMVVAYDGAPFHGFAPQRGLPTVAGSLAEALQRSLQLPEPPQLTCAGRTDAGVHAIGQVVSCDLPDPLPDYRGAERSASSLLDSINRQLSPQVVVRQLEPAAQDFDARFSATWRRYRYLIWNAGKADPLLAPVAWHVAPTLDRHAMLAAVDCFVGPHDFRAFCRRPPGTSAADPLPRTVTECSLRVVPDAHVADLGEGTLYRLEVQANAFCHQMVRSIVAQVVDVGLGRSTPADAVALLRSGSRQGAAQPAPAHGLCFLAVGYGS